MEIKKKSFITLILAILMMLAVLIPSGAFAAGFPLTGSGTEADPYQIKSVGDLEWLAQNNDANGGFANTYFIQTAPEIDMSGINDMTPIGNDAVHFKGVFNGNGNTISNLTMVDNSDHTSGLLDYGLFGNVDGVIENVILNNVNVTANGFDSSINGILTGFNSGIIKNCKITGVSSLTVTHGCYAGTIAGRNEGTVKNSVNEATITVSVDSCQVGGLVGYNIGYNDGVIANSINKGNINYIGNPNCEGGIAGYDSLGDIYFCINVGNVQATGEGNIGSIIGYLSSKDSDGPLDNYYLQGSADNGIGYDNSGENNLNNGCIVKIDSELKEQGTYTGFDFINNWSIDEGNTYPEPLSVALASTFAITVVPGAVSGSTSVTPDTSLASGHYLVINVKGDISDLIKPDSGDMAPKVSARIINPYNEGNDISSVNEDGTSYIVVYDVNSLGNIERYNVVAATIDKIKPFSIDTSKVWLNVGTNSLPHNGNWYPSLTLDSSEIPYVAYTDTDNHYKATVKKFNGTSWDTVGTEGFTPDEADYTSIAIDNSGTPYIAYQDYANNYKLSVMKYGTETGWIPVGTEGISAGGVQNNNISIVIDNDGAPCVAYEDVDTGNIVVVKYNEAESKWVTLGSGDFAETNYSSLAKNSHGELYIAYADDSNNSKGTVKKFDGTNWVTVGTEGFSEDTAYCISMAIDNNTNTPYVAYQDNAHYNKVTVKKFDGTNWVTVGTEGCTSGPVFENISFVISSDGTPYLAYTDITKSFKLIVMKYDKASSNWVILGNQDISIGMVPYISLVVDNNEVPYVAYDDFGDINKAYVKKYSLQDGPSDFGLWNGQTSASDENPLDFCFSTPNTSWLSSINQIVISKDGGTTEGVDKWTVKSENIVENEAAGGENTYAFYDDYGDGKNLIILPLMGEKQPICKAGNYTIIVSATGYNDKTSNFVITNTDPSSIKVIQEPTSVASGGNVSTVKVEIVDKYDNPCTIFSTYIPSEVTASAKNDWTIGGTTTAIFDENGIATFDGITATKAEGLTGAIITFSTTLSGGVGMQKPILFAMADTKTVTDGPLFLAGLIGNGDSLTCDTSGFNIVSENALAANNSIATAKGLLPDSFTAIYGTTTNLLTALNGITGMSDTGVTLTLTSSNANVANDGIVTYTINQITDNVIVHISKESGLEDSKTISVTIPAHSSNSHHSGGGTTPTVPIQQGDKTINIEVNGTSQDNVKGTVTQVTSNGLTTTIVTIDDVKLNEVLNNKNIHTVITTPVLGITDAVIVKVDGQTVKNMEEKEAVFEVKTDTVTYILPASEINIDAVSSQIGNQVELKDIKVNIQIAQSSTETANIVEDTAHKNNYQVVVRPVDFEITCTSGSRTVDVSRFDKYVERQIAIPDGVDPSKITTGVVVNPNGSFSHVPTMVTKINGKYYARINSLTNSSYSVIYSPKSFKDVEKHWAKEDINDMASRLIIDGVGNNMFEPDKYITRAEFAAIMVKALGLRPETGDSPFSDIKVTDWYNGYIKTAYDYKLISGYDNGKFGPMDKITREQVMTIIARAMDITGLKTDLSSTEALKLLTSFKDANKSADYAKINIATCIKTRIVTGRDSNLIAPKDSITRAEVAVIMRRLLQKSSLF